MDKCILASQYSLHIFIQLCCIQNLNFVLMFWVILWFTASMVTPPLHFVKKKTIFLFVFASMMMMPLRRSPTIRFLSFVFKFIFWTRFYKKKKNYLNRFVISPGHTIFVISYYYVALKVFFKYFMRVMHMNYSMSVERLMEIFSIFRAVHTICIVYTHERRERNYNKFVIKLILRFDWQQLQTKSMCAVYWK